MFIAAIVFAAITALAFASGQNAFGIVLIVVVSGFVFAGINERNAYNQLPDFNPNSLQNNIFFDHPMAKDILMMIETTGCCESLSFEPETAIRCERRSFGEDDENEFYYDFKLGERKFTLTLDEQCELLKLLKHYLPNGETYRIQAAYDKNEYDALQKTAKMEYFYSDGKRVKNSNYGREILPENPKYYMMFTTFYQNKRWNKERRRWEMPISIYKPVEVEHKAV